MHHDISLATSEEVGKLGIVHLKQFWSAHMLIRAGKSIEREKTFYQDRLLIDALGLGLQKTVMYLFRHAPSFDEFEIWVAKTSPTISPSTIERLNADLLNQPHPQSVCQLIEEIESHPPVLSEEDLAFWERYGYVVLKNAIPASDLAATEQLVWAFREADPHQPQSWYQKETGNIWVELIQHPQLERNRTSKRIHKAFAQLWGTADLWVSADRCGFNPPETATHQFPGPDLHWDVDFSQPLAFGTQGILYLTDTPPEQGAFTLVPGFQHKLADWLQTLDSNQDLHQQDLHALGSKPIGGKAGDLVIWHQWLPHGSRPNLGTLPRIVQYINMNPGRLQ